MRKTLRKGSRCPACTIGRLILIVYGLPFPETFEAYKRGEISLLATSAQIRSETLSLAYASREEATEVMLSSAQSSPGAPKMEMCA
jgi:hypothetical protein